MRGTCWQDGRAVWVAMVHSKSIVAPVHPHLESAVQRVKPGRVCSRLPVAALLQEAATSERRFLRPGCCVLF